jgi:hypothetical protein
MELTKKALRERVEFEGDSVKVLTLECCVCFMLELLDLSFAVQGMGASRGAGVWVRMCQMSVLRSL